MCHGWQACKQGVGQSADTTRRRGVKVRQQRSFTQANKSEETKENLATSATKEFTQLRGQGN